MDEDRDRLNPKSGVGAVSGVSHGSPARGGESGVPEDVLKTLSELGVEVSGGAWGVIGAYLRLLMEANQQFNLTAIRDLESAWRRHILDSLTLLPFLKKLSKGAGVIDIGSGGGLPGVPVAIARGDLRVTLLEATGKKAGFLQRCVEELPLPDARVVLGRAETVGQDPQHRQRYDVALCRAIGPMSELLEYALPLVRMGGRLLAMKGPGVVEELEGAGDALAVLGGGEIEIVPAYPQGHEVESVIVVVGKDRPTPKTYPRRPGVPRQSPL